MKVVVFDPLSMTHSYDAYLVLALRRLGLDVSLTAITTHYDPAYYKKLGIETNPDIDIAAKLKIENQTMRRAVKLFEYIANLSRATTRWKTDRPDVVHVQWLRLSDLWGVESRFLKRVRALGIPVVYTVHNLLPHDTGEKYRDKYQRFYDLSDALVCHTADSAEALANKFGQPRDKVTIVPFGPVIFAENAPSRDEARKMLGIPDAMTVVGFLGSLKPYKGVDTMLDAWKKIVASNGKKPMLLLIAGSIEKSYKRAALKMIEDSGSNGSIRAFNTYVTNEDMAAYHAASDMLVYPYKNITQSSALLTGMDFSKPIIATSVGGFVETLANGRGKLIPANDSSALAESILALASNASERERLGRAAKEYVAYDQSWNKAAEITSSLYRRLVGMQQLADVSFPAVVQTAEQMLLNHQTILVRDNLITGHRDSSKSDEVPAAVTVPVTSSSRK